MNRTKSIDNSTADQSDTILFGKKRVSINHLVLKINNLNEVRNHSKKYKSQRFQKIMVKGIRR